MRLLGYVIIGAALVLAGVWALAEVSLHEFEPGDVIRSNEVNENFASLADAVTLKQDRVAGQCAPGSSIRVINEDGTVICHVDQLGEPGEAGVASLNGKTGSVVLQAGANISIDDSAAGEIVITAVGGDNGGLMAVASDGTLTGDGTGSAPLGLADGAVTGPKLSDFGASAGQVLKFDGSNWAAADDKDTTYSAGTGLNLSGNEFSLDTALTDSRYLAPDANGGFALAGESSGGPIPAEGAGTRLMWYPGKAALRVGGVSGSQWDDGNVGQSSVAMGVNTIASGGVSLATGSFTTASANFSTAMGYATTASGDYSTAMGVSTIARGFGSLAVGEGTRALANHMVAIGRYNSPTGVSGSNAPDRPLFVVGNGSSNANRSYALQLRANGDLHLSGLMQLGAFPSSTGTGVCVTTNGTLANCSSSARYKEEIHELDSRAATSIVEKLRPVTFRWKESGLEDLGLIAEDLAELEPRLVTYNSDGEIEGIKYSHLSAMLVGALQEMQLHYDATFAAQQAQIEALSEQLIAQQEAFDARLAALEQLAAGELVER